MKTKIFTSLLTGVCLLLASSVYAGGPSGGINNCIDSNLINPNAVCPMVYAPVCGCDGVTYFNDCDAQAHGVISYTTGACGNGGSGPGDSTGTGIGDSTTCYPPYFYYTIDSTGRVVSFMYSSYTIYADGTLGGDSNNIPLGAPAGGTTSPGSFSLLWDFGDGTTSTDINPVHTYADTASGNYTVCLTLTDSVAGCTAQYCELIYNYNGDCNADFDWYYDPTNDSIVFVNNTPGSGDSTVVIWSFGDGSVAGGTTNDSTGVSTPGYVYGSDGTYVPCLSVYDPQTGCFSMVCDTIVYYKMASGIAKNEKAPLNFSISPNPANDKVFITYHADNKAPVKISVIDVTGKTISRFNLNNTTAGSRSIEWDTQAVSSGMYIIRVEDGNSSASKRVIVNH